MMLNDLVIDEPSPLRAPFSATDHLIDRNGHAWRVGQSDIGVPQVSPTGLTNPLVSQHGLVHMCADEELLIITLSPARTEPRALVTVEQIALMLGPRLTMVTLVGRSDTWEVFRSHAAALCWIELILGLHGKLILSPTQMAQLVCAIDPLDKAELALCRRGNLIDTRISCCIVAGAH